LATNCVESQWYGGLFRKSGSPAPPSLLGIGASQPVYGISRFGLLWWSSFGGCGMLDVPGSICAVWFVGGWVVVDGDGQPARAALCTRRDDVAGARLLWLDAIAGGARAIARDAYVHASLGARVRAAVDGGCARPARDRAGAGEGEDRDGHRARRAHVP
jgi:hypothetical protein